MKNATRTVKFIEDSSSFNDDIDDIDNKQGGRHRVFENRIRKPKSMVGKFSEAELMNDTQKWSLEKVDVPDTLLTPVHSTRILIQPKKPLNYIKSFGDSFGQLAGA